MTLTIDIIGGGLIAGIIGLAVTWWRIDARRERDGADLFRQPGRHRAPEPAPAPAREPDTLDRLAGQFAAAPVATPPQASPKPDPAEDTLWRRHTVTDVWAVLRAEAGMS